MKHCDKCNLDFPEHFRFCGSCGGELVDKRKCSNCGTLVDLKWPFCTSCGSQLSSEAPKTLKMPASELPTSEVAFPRSRELDRQSLSMQEPTRESANRYTEPGELYGADLSQKTTAASSKTHENDPTSELDNSETAEIVSDSQNFSLPLQTHQAGTVNTVTHAESQPQRVTIAASSVPEVRAAPTLSMMESYGRTPETPTQFRWWPGAIVVLVVLLFAASVLIGGWYWWSHRQPPAQAAVEPTTPNRSSVSETPSISPTPKSSSTPIPSANLTADEEFRSLQNKRVAEPGSDKTDLVAAYAAAEQKYPNDYRFPYERAKLSIFGVTSHHEAFDALASAAEKAIDGGKAQQMLDSLNADKDSDFYKLSRGHREWQTLEQALLSKDKSSLKALHH